MLQLIFAQDAKERSPIPQEGTLFKIANVHGHTFELYYGYYDEQERNNPAAEPMPIYPDFIRKPQYTSDGYAFVTQMQDICPYYRGEAERCEDRCCAECEHYCHGDELLGICTCPFTRKSPAPPEERNE